MRRRIDAEFIHELKRRALGQHLPWIGPETIGIVAEPLHDHRLWGALSYAGQTAPRNRPHVRRGARHVEPEARDLGNLGGRSEAVANQRLGAGHNVG